MMMEIFHFVKWQQIQCFYNTTKQFGGGGSEVAKNISLTHKVVQESIKVESTIDRKENDRSSLIPG